MKSGRWKLVIGAIASSAIALIACEATALVRVIGVEELRFGWAPAPGLPDGYLVSIARNGMEPAPYRVVQEPSVVIPVEPGDRIAIQVRAGRATPDGIELGPASALSEAVWVFPSPELPVEGQWTLTCATCPAVELRSLADASVVEASSPGTSSSWRLEGRATPSSGSDALVWYHPQGGIALWDTDELLLIQGSVTSAPRDMAYLGAADFDADGVEEIVFFDPTFHVARLFGLTAGGLDPLGIVSGPTGADAVALGDFTGDGAIEFAWRFSAEKRLELRRLDGAALGRIASSVPSPGLLAGYVGDAEVADGGDYDGDGHLDLLLRRPDGALLILYLTSGSVRRVVTLPAIGGDEERDVVGSVDADGIAGLEIALQDRTTGTISLLSPSDELTAARTGVLTAGASWRVVDVR